MAVATMAPTRAMTTRRARDGARSIGSGKTMRVAPRCARRATTTARARVGCDDEDETVAASGVALALAFGVGYASAYAPWWPFKRVMTPPTVASVVVRESDVDAYVTMRDEVEAAAMVEAETEVAEAAAEATTEAEAQTAGTGFIMPLAVALGAVLVASVGYLKRYEIAVGTASLLHAWETNDPNFPSCDIRWRKSVEEEKSKSEALNEEWTERLMTIKGEFRQRIDELHADLERAEGNAILMREKIEANESQHDIAMNESRQNLESVENELRNERETSANEIQELRRRLEEMENSSRELRAELDVEKSQIQTDAREQLERAVGDVDALRAELDGVRGEKDRVCGELESLRAEFEDIRGEKDRAWGEADSVRGEKDQAWGEVETLRSELEGVRADKDRAWGEVESIRADKDQAWSEVETLRAELEAVRGEKDQAWGEVESVRGELEGMRGEKDQAWAELEAVRGEKDQAWGEVETLRSELEGVRADKDRAWGEVESIRADKDQAWSEVETLRAELDGVRGEKDQAWGEVESLREAKSNNEIEFEEQLRYTLERKDEAVREKNELQQLLANLRSELEANVELRDSLQRDKAVEDELVEELRSEIERLRAELDSAIENATRALGKYAELDSALPEIVTAIDRLRSLAHMATEESPMIKHAFELADVPPTQPGEFVVVAGSWNDWDVQKGEVMMFDVDTQTWKCSIELQSDVVYEYKCCICAGGVEERFPLYWQIGANSAFAVASSLVNARKLRPEAMQTTHWVTNPANAPIIMQDEDGEIVRLSSTQLMTDLPTNLISTTIDDLSQIITEATTGIDDQILKTQAAVATL